MINKFILEIDRVLARDWEQILLKFDDANLYQTWEYGAAKWGEEALIHAVLKKDDQIVAAAQIWLKKFPIFKAGFAHISMGPMWRLKGQAIDFGVVRNMIRKLYQEFVIKRGLLLRIRSYEFDNEIEGKQIKEILRSGHLIKTSEAQDRTVLLDLSPDLCQLRANLKKSWRRQLKKAEEEHFETIATDDMEALVQLRELYREMLGRKKFTFHLADLDQLLETQRNLPEALKMKIFLCKHNEVYIGGQLLSVIGNTGIAIIAAICDNSLEFKHGISHFFEWDTIRWLKEKGFAQYNLNGYDPERYPGPSHYKEGLSGEIVSYLGMYEASRSSLTSLLVFIGRLMNTAVDQAKALFCKLRSFI
jgi:lipid II:glycine glycyltransferase (peptidoglycan interpeptide bridge formation enzyme)